MKTYSTSLSFVVGFGETVKGKTGVGSPDMTSITLKTTSC